jgi:DNA repair ATPase RecN
MLAQAQQKGSNANHVQLNEQLAQFMGQIHETMGHMTERMAQLEGDLVRKEEERKTLIEAHTAAVKGYNQTVQQLTATVNTLAAENLQLKQRLVTLDTLKQRFDGHTHLMDATVQAKETVRRCSAGHYTERIEYIYGNTGLPK